MACCGLGVPIAAAGYPRSMPTGASVAVVGAGVLGLSTAHALAELGASPTVYESRRPGHGQSVGEARVFRHGHDDRRLCGHVRDARTLWDEWGERFGTELVSADGAVALGPAVERRLRVLEEVGGVPVRRIDADELADRLPLLAPYDGPAMLDERGGAIRARATIAALAGALGDAIRLDEVLSLRRTARRSVEILAGAERTEHERVVLCAGRGTAQLARGIGLDLPVRLAAHARLTFDVRGPAPPRLASLLDGSGAWGQVGTYASAQPGNGRVALGVFGTVDAREDGSLVDPESLAALGDRAAAYVREALPGLRPEPVEVVHCWVTTLPWGEDGVAAWDEDGVVAVAGNNLFKQAPWLGRALARAALGDGLEADLRPESRLGAAS